MKRDTPEAELRRQLVKTVSVTDEEFQWLKVERYVDLCLDEGEEETTEDLAAFVLKRRASTATPRPKGVRPGAKPLPEPQFEDWIPKEETLRAQVFTNCMALNAAHDSRVRGFRKKNLGGRTIVAKSARKLLASDAPRIFGREFFKKHRIPLSDHKSWFVAYDKMGKPIPDLAENAQVEIVWKGASLEVPLSLRRQMALAGKQTPHLAILRTARQRKPERGFADPMGTFLRGSVFDELHGASAGLVRRFGWPEDDAAWFVLTGQPPRSLPVRLSQQNVMSLDSSRSQLKITVDLWTSPRTVASIYQKAQRLALGRQSRRFSERNLLLVDYVSGEIEKSRTTPDRRELMESWNEANPDHEYENPQIFWRDYRHTLSALVYPRMNVGSGR